jgi:hypothetical protein
MDYKGGIPSSEEVDFWFCHYPSCRNRIIGPVDPKMVRRDHSDHNSMDNFATFLESHEKFLAMVKTEALRPPWVLEKEVVTLGDALIKKFTIEIDKYKDEMIKYSIKFNLAT